MVKVTQNSFLGGQLDFEMMGRQDMEKYSKGATTLLNFLPLKRGGIRKRPGTFLRHDVTDRIAASGGRFRLVPFAWREGDGWALLFTEGAILAFSSSETVEVARETTAQFYTGGQIGELDYCQSGDVLFIAHQTHAPCRVEHVFSGGAHAFTLKAMDFNMLMYGRPQVQSAKVSKQKVLDLGGVVTEKYKVTAVYDGVETFPCEAYGGGGAGDDGTADYSQWKTDNASKMQNGTAGVFYPPAVTYDGTSYHAPWTKSQTIELKVALPVRSLNGVSMFPDELRFYRKTGGLYGLVGFLKTGGGTVPEQVLTYSDDTVGHVGAGGEAYDGTALLVGPGEAELGVAFTRDIVGAAVRVRLGRLEAEVVGDTCTVTANLCGVAISGWTREFYVRVKLKLGDTVVANARIPVADPKTKTYGFDRRTGESDGDLRARALAEANSKADLPFVAAVVSGSSADEVNSLSVSAETDCWMHPDYHQKPVWLNGCEVTDISYKTEQTSWTDEYYTPDASLTPPKEEECMGGAGEWPACVALSQQRLIWASTLNDPSRVMMSQVGDFYVYAPHDVPADDDPVDFQVSATRFPKVNHLVEMRKLLMFNGDSEWVVDSASTSSGITYATVQARQHSSIGAAAWLKPIVCNNVLLFAEKTGKAVRRYGYQLEDDGFGGVDVSILSSSIFRDRKIVSWAFQKHPNSTCWCVLSDGALASLTFMPEQQTVAWATHMMGGGGLARQVVCTEAVTGNAGALADTSQVFVVVERGGTFAVEEFRRDCRHGSDAVANAVCMDSVRVLAAGDTPRDGATLVDPETGEVLEASVVEYTEDVAGWLEGFAFESLFESVHPVVGSDVGLAQMDVKCVQAAHLRTADAVGGEVRGIAVPRAEGSLLAQTAASFDGEGMVSLPTVDENVPLVTDNNRDGRVAVSQSEPWPFTLLMLETDVEAEVPERGRG